MKTSLKNSRFHILSAAITAAVCVVPAHAADGVFYDPSNAASPTGKTIGYELYRTIGCPGRELTGIPCPAPVDTDGDGVTDDKDKCPNTPAGRKVDADGCEIDTDGDGLVDGEDKCPTVYAKTPDGCPLEESKLAPDTPPAAAPVPAPVPDRLVLEDINFDYDRAALRPDEIPVLNDAATKLKEWGDIKVEVEGHTDSRGSDAYNLKLSLRRAESVRSYLVGRGIAEDRLSVKGYGESRPVADNGTPEGRFKNRRVEIAPIK